MTSSERARIGARLKAERTARGWTQRELAEFVAEAMGGALTTDLATLIEYVKRWERGRSGVGPRYRRALADALGVPRHQLFEPADAEDDPVQRRKFLGFATVAGLSASPWNPANHLDFPPGRRIGADIVERLQLRTARLRRLDDVLGGADTYRIYAAELAATRNLMKTSTCTEATSRALLKVVAEQAQQAGWAALDAGQSSDSRTLYRDSMSAAADAGSTALMGNALALMSYQQVAAGRSGTDEADAACRVIAPHAPRTVKALLHERAAWAHAMAGPGHTRQVELALEAARNALAEKATDDPDWARWVDEVELHIMTGRCNTILHRPDRAVPALEWALARFNDSHARDKSLYLSWLADAHIDAGEVDQAARTLSRSIDFGADIASVRPGRRIRAVAERLRPHAAVSTVGDVLEQARTMCGSLA